MSSMLRWLVFLVLSLAGGAALAQPADLSVGRLDHVRVLVPAQMPPTAMAVHISDLAGWTKDDDAIAAALQERGVAVLGVDYAAYRAKLDADGGACLYVVGEITDLAQTAQRELSIQTYLPPMVTGRGEGATFAYAALADAPANTLGGAVGWDFRNNLSLRLPFCPGATATPDGAGFTYGFDRALPEAGTLYVARDLLEEVVAKASGLQNLSIETLDHGDAAGQIAEALTTLSESRAPFGGIPAIDLPASAAPRALAILVSGDGGWRDIDKSMGEWLSNNGVHVVGLDALRYFWSHRSPQELAHDVGVLVREADPAGTLPVMLIGYSFGADTLPFAYPLLDKVVRDRVQLLALLAPGRSTSFQVTVTGWLGISDKGYDIPPAIAALPAQLVLCVYGREDSDSACADRLVHRATILRTEGGHHFDGDYAALAKTMLDRLPATNP